MCEKEFYVLLQAKKEAIFNFFLWLSNPTFKKAFKESEKIASLGAFCNFFTLKKFKIFFVSHIVECGFVLSLIKCLLRLEFVAIANISSIIDS